MGKIRYSILVCALLATNSFAQQQTMAGRILVCIKPESVAAFRSAFESPEIHALKFDPQKFSLKDNSVISDLFSLPSILHASSLKPLIPQHNVVLENLREHTNPVLFTKNNPNGIGIKETDDIASLRATEEKISRWFELFYDGNISPESAVIILRKSGVVEIAEPRYRNKTCFTPNDLRFPEQYSLPLIHAPEAWDIVRCDSTMLVADDDIGSDWTHPDLAQTIFINKGETGLDADGFDKRSNGIDDDGDGFIDDWHGWDFAGDNGTAPDNDPNTHPSVGTFVQPVHGTHTAGIMAASGNNGIGVCGVAFGAKILILKCGDSTGGDVSFGYEGIVYAADRGAKVVNNSWGGTNRSQIGQDIVNYATAKNCAVVAASGNSYAFQDFYPSSFDHVLSVAAVDESGSITDFSNFNTHVDVSAPGHNVLSTIPNQGYTWLTGTSMASPTASGGIALIRQKFPNLSADQAIQRLRATCDPLTTGQDLHPGYTGKGLINLKRAVSDNPVYSVRLESKELLDDNHNGILEPGEGADVILHVRNYLMPLTELQAKIEYLNDTGKFIMPNTETVHFGIANTLELVQNIQGSFHITMSQNTPPNYTVTIRLTFFSSAQGYGPDIDYFSLTINPGYLNLDKNNLTVTFDSKGGIGYNDPPNNTQGIGFLWTNAPPSIFIQGRDILSQAGLMIGVDDSARIVSSAPGEYSDGYAMQDFSLERPIHYVTPSDHSNAVQELHTIFADTHTDPSLQVGVSVEEKTYDFIKDLAANAVVLDYMMHKRTVDSISYVSDATAAALFMDWDIGVSGDLNKAYISTLDSAISVTRRMENLYPFVGIKLISDIPAGAALNFYAIDNDGSNGSVNKHLSFTRSAKWKTMTTPRPVAGIGDVSMVYGLKNLPLLSQDSLRLTFVIAMAENEELLKQTIDQTRTEWFATSGVRSVSESPNTLVASPNPFGRSLHITWKSDLPHDIAEIEITDMIGRILISRKVEGTSLDLAGLALPSGTYILTVRQGAVINRRTVVCLP